MSKTINWGRLYLDTNLGFVIQQVSGDSKADILSYFQSIAEIALQDAVVTSKARHRIHKTVQLLYKKSPIPFRLEVTAHHRDSYLVQVDWKNVREIYARIDIKFPPDKDSISCKEVSSYIAETGLGLADASSAADHFPIPSLKCPTALKSFKDESKHFIKKLNTED